MTSKLELAVWCAVEAGYSVTLERRVPSERWPRRGDDSIIQERYMCWLQLFDAGDEGEIYGGGNDLLSALENALAQLKTKEGRDDEADRALSR